MFSFSDCPHPLTAFACTPSCPRMWTFISFAAMIGGVSISVRGSYQHLRFSHFQPLHLTCSYLHNSLLQELLRIHLRPPALSMRIVFAFALGLRTTSPHLRSCARCRAPSYNLFSAFSLNTDPRFPYNAEWPVAGKISHSLAPFFSLLISSIACASRVNTPYKYPYSPSPEGSQSWAHIPSLHLRCLVRPTS